MSITVNLQPEQYRQLQAIATRKGCDVESLLTQVATEYLTRTERVESAMQYVLTKNDELYHRLAK
jgi:predicted DNA-binding ribbon-helix-helix protein